MSLPARVVGGDLYDFLPLDADTLAVTIADAAGHGLPAALQARDVVTGLRIGVERDLKIPRTVEKLNRVIHRSGLVSRFVSLVFGTSSRTGTSPTSTRAIRRPCCSTTAGSTSCRWGA